MKVELMMNCPVCQNKKFTEQHLIPQISVNTCQNCGIFIQIIDRTGLVRAKSARINYHARHKSIDRVRQDQSYKIISLVKKHGFDSKDWLDIGCGYGYLLHEAKRCGYNVFGVEPDEKAFENSRELIGANLIHNGFMTNETRPDNSADIISTLDVLEHIPVEDLSNFAHMIYRKLKPHGLWAVKVPSTDGMYFIIAHILLKYNTSIISSLIKRIWQSEHEFPHTVYFNQRTLKLFLENHGFEVISFHYFEDVPNNTVLNRLLLDDTIPKWAALLITPVFYLINLVEKWRGKSDALFMLARRK